MGDTPVRGKPIAIPWKAKCNERHSSIKKKRTTNYNFSNWGKRQGLRQERERIKQLEKELKANDKEEKKRRREENEARRIINERKSEQLQKITNTTKLKKLSKKQ